MKVAERLGWCWPHRQCQRQESRQGRWCLRLRITKRLSGFAYRNELEMKCRKRAKAFNRKGRRGHAKVAKKNSVFFSCSRIALRSLWSKAFVIGSFQGEPFTSAARDPFCRE